MKGVRKAYAASIRCEQSANEANSLNVWLGRIAMVGFAVAISVEISTGKGLLEVWSRNTSFICYKLYILTYHTSDRSAPFSLGHLQLFMYVCNVLC